jgi:EpsI family protein
MNDRADIVSKPLDRRAFLIGGTMAATAGVAALRMPRPNRPSIREPDFEAMVPNTVGAWRYQQSSGLVLPPEDALSDRLYDNLVTRIYTDPSDQVMMLLIAYKNFQDGMLQIHRPEICYPAGGYRLSQTLPTAVPIAPGVLLPANTFSAINNTRDEQVLYWTRIGDSFPVRWSAQRFAVLRANLNKINPDGLLVRVSMLGNDMDASMPAMTHFVGELRAAASPRLRKLLFGPLA